MTCWNGIPLPFSYFVLGLVLVVLTTFKQCSNSSELEPRKVGIVDIYVLDACIHASAVETLFA